MPRHCFLTSPGGRSSDGRGTSVTAISAPCAASLSAVARPMPFIPPAPVIRATLLSSPAMHYLLCLLPPPATASAEGAQFNGRPFPATASAEGAQFNGPPSLRERAGVRGFIHSIREKPRCVISAG